ncbi:MAG: DUF4861 domain-containing protein [Prevotella sp.]|nr:DUF4861 domain-containing protein [Prevotella sp.]
MNKAFVIIFAFIALSVNAQDKLTVTVENPLKMERKDAPVVVRLSQTGKMVRSALVTCGGQEIPSQLDDLNGDKRFDELCFTTDLGKLEKKEFQVTLYNEGSPRKYEPRVYIEMVLPNSKVKQKNKHDMYISELTVDRGVNSYNLQHHHGIDFESELTGFRIYFDHRQSIDLYGKQKKQLELRETQFYTQPDQLEQGYGDDVLWCGQTFALGALRGWDGKQPTMLDDVEHRTQRIIARGPVRVIAEVVCDEWNAPCPTSGALPVTLRERYTQWAGHRDVTVAAKFSRPVADYSFSTGIINVKGSEEFSDKKGLRGCWGSDYTVSGKDTLTLKKETVGLGICIPRQYVKQELKADSDNYGFVISTTTDELSYAITFGSNNETFGYHSAKEWFGYLAEWKRELDPVIVNVRQ